ncbi:MAG: gamma-glutamyltransferase [Bacillati bacterium ANGP1]|uniref:Glutathione hydrolase proenzyme n=1 Tax=Candidatus Segetimicrobium genomatis TaxID=2569760 RepID=A0A537K0U8_9BACT|nr:MAG: gamma-glutamyltransferase [Terrabacteria group bacterium ANGP1]
MTDASQGRSAVLAQRGLVATDHPLASAAGLRVLEEGGNAIDAAVCVAAVLGVVTPMMTGIGGDSFIVHYHAATQRVLGLNGSGAAPQTATPEVFRQRGFATMPLRGMLAPSVPGAVDAMATALGQWGSGRFTLGRLLEPAIHYAEAGFPITEKVAAWFARTAEGEVAPILARYPSSARIYLPNGRTPRVGEVFVQSDLARSLRAIAERGARAFYEGPLADAIADYAQSHGGLITAADLAAHHSELCAPLTTTHRDLVIHTTPPPSQGFVLLEMLNILEQAHVETLPWGSAEAIHLMTEAKKLAFADRLAYVGDPRFVSNPLDRLLSKEHARDRTRAIDPRRAQEQVPAGALREQVGETTAFVVADAEGNVVSYITSLSAAFGCGEVVDGTGILLNNRGGRGFTLEPGHPNEIAPGKRTMHTLMAFLATREGRPHLAWATRGGDAQAPWNLQTFSNIVHHGLNVQEAVDRPRWFSFPATDPATIRSPFELRMESGFPAATYEGLRALGHRVVTPYPAAGQPSSGGLQVIQVVDPDRRVYAGGSDPRAGGCAIGF